MKTIAFLFLLFLCSCVNIHANEGVSIVNSLEDAVALSESTKMPVLLIFGAEWCGYCKNLKKDIETGVMNKELENYIICYIDVDKHKDIKKEFKVSSIPDSRIIVDKKETAIKKGYVKDQYKKWINENTK